MGQYFFFMGVSENVVYPIVPNGVADQTIPFLNCYFIGNINPTFSDKPLWQISPCLILYTEFLLGTDVTH